MQAADSDRALKLNKGTLPSSPLLPVTSRGVTCGGTLLDEACWCGDLTRVACPHM